MTAYADSDHATFLDTRRSVSGEAVLLGRGAISWFPRTQRVTATGTSESEYVALWEGIIEVLFLRQVQEFVTPTINDYSVIVNEDNQGTIKMANNKFSR